MKVAIGTLHQHFGDTRRTTKIAIDLERGMCVKQIIIRASSTFIRADWCELILYQLVSMIAIL